MAISIGRRRFISAFGVSLAWPFAARAQQPTMPVIGFLSTRAPGEDPHLLVAFQRGLADAGYVEGRNVTIEYRFAENRNDRLLALATDLVRRQVAAIIGNGPAASAAKAATGTIPIIFAVGFDPVQAGLVASLNRPGGNATGVSIFDVELGPKRLELLQEVLPGAAFLDVLVNPTDPARAGRILAGLQEAAAGRGVKLDIVNAGNDSDIEKAFATLVQSRAPGLLISGDPFFTSRSGQLAALTLRHGLPAIFGWREFAASGGLMTYGTSLPDSFRQIGVYTGRILKGERPEELPVVQPTKFEFVLNLKTAKALGLTIPTTLRATADDVIE